MNATERLRIIQRHELNARLDWLKDHLNRLADVPEMQQVVKGWRFETRQKQLLLHELKAGKEIDDRAVRTCFNVVAALRRAHLRRTELGYPEFREQF